VLLGSGLTVLLLLGGGFVAYKKMAQEEGLAGPGPAAQPSVAPTTPSASARPVVVLPGSTPPKPARTSGPAGSARPAKGTFTLADDVSEITIRTSRLDRGIARVTVPDGSNAAPRTTVDGGSVRLAVGTGKGGGRTNLVVQLDSRVSWAVRLVGGARDMTIDLSGGSVRSVEFDGGAAQIDLRLPKPDRTVPIRMAGGVNQWRITTEGRVAVDVLARRGAGRVVLYGRDRGGLGRGGKVSADGRSGIDIDATAGFGTLTVAEA
jgi:hypothetical protein